MGSGGKIEGGHINAAGEALRLRRGYDEAMSKDLPVVGVAGRMTDVGIVTPVFNDWDSFEQLLHALGAQAAEAGCRFHVLAVDDGSTQTHAYAAERYKGIASIEVARLVCNLGHQRAIAVGLSLACQRHDLQAIVVMDSDGEDNPADVPRLLDLARRHAGAVVVAQRQKRSESLRFRLFYRLYKALFRWMTDATIDFGNFVVLPPAAARALAHNPATWNHLAATITRSRLPLVRLPTARARRYAGTSQMNFVALMLHGLSAISVYSDVLMARVIVALLAVSGVTLFGLLVVVAVRLFTSLAIPGWASFIGASLVIVLLQSLVFAVLLIFLALSQRSAKPVVPISDGLAFVAERPATPAQAIARSDSARP
jgi:glycosyltransferase involved in cell wall biosynthesis